MPTIRAYTNVSRQDLPDGFLKGFLAQLAKTLHRDEKHVTLHFLSDQMLCRGADGDPMCYVEVFNTGGHGEPDEIRAKVVGISTFLKEKLNISDGEKIQVLFHVIPPKHVGIGTGKILSDFVK